MTNDDAYELVTGLLARHCGVEPSVIDGSMRLQDDLGLDSIDAAELLIVLEDRSGIRFELESIEDVETVDAIVARLLASSGMAVALETR